MRNKPVYYVCRYAFLRDYECYNQEWGPYPTKTQARQELRYAQRDSDAPEALVIWSIQQREE